RSTPASSTRSPRSAMSLPGRPADRPASGATPLPFENTRKLEVAGRVPGEPDPLPPTYVGPVVQEGPRRFDETAAYGSPPDDSARTLQDEGTAAASELPLDAMRFAQIDRGTYIILDKFAQGGIGRILRAHDPRLDRPVALKELLIHGRKV